MEFIPNSQNLVDVIRNRRPARVTLYEHWIDGGVIGEILECEMRLDCSNPSSIKQYYTNYCRFWREMTYDTISFEGCITNILPDHGAILGGRPGPIQTRADFEAFPFAQLSEMYWNHWQPHFDAIAPAIPSGMALVGGVGNGVLEICEDLIGYEYLCVMLHEEPELFAAIVSRVGDLLVELWEGMLARYGNLIAVGRMGDDLGFKTSTLLRPKMIIDQFVPQYRRVIELVKSASKPFLLHSCGCIFDVMDALIDAGIDAKHSNEDQIAPYSDWLARYGSRIGLVGGIDLNVLCTRSPDEILDYVLEQATVFRAHPGGWALGSGNSIPHYVPAQNYLAMIRAGQKLRELEIVGTPLASNVTAQN